jgi:hypothetical protein
MELRTDLQIQREKDHKAIAEEFISLVQSGMMKTVATRTIRKKWGIHSDNTVYRIRKEYERNQVNLLSKAIDAEGLFEAIEEICKDFKRS